MRGYLVEAVLNRLMKNAAVVAVGGVVAKLIGAIYRVPLTNILGAEGIGIYQMVFPFYCILLTLSSTGIPAGIAKLTAEGKDALKRSVVIFGVIGLIGTLIMFFGADTIAGLQGNVAAASAYRALSPSVFFVSLLSSLRGYFQGKLNMLPTALSQVIEQIVKLAVGLFLCANFGVTLADKAALAAFSVTLSEIVALIYVLTVRREKRTSKGQVSAKLLITTVLPITLCSIMLPVSKAVDSFTAVRLIGGGAAEATANYGLYSGVVESIVALPVAVCYSLAVSGLPLIAKSKVSGNQGDHTKKILLYTLISGAAFAVFTFLFARFAISFLYPRLSAEHTDTAVTLLRISALSVLGLSLVQSFSAIFIGKGKMRVAPSALFVGVFIKIIITFAIVPMEGVGVYGYAISDIFCYFVATGVFLLYSIRERKTYKKDETANAVIDSGAWRKKRRSFRQRLQ